jgi:hypothetical protein
MKGHFEIADQERTEITMRLTMSIKEWRELQSALGCSDKRTHFEIVLREGIWTMLSKIGDLMESGAPAKTPQSCAHVRKRKQRIPSQ